jgi:hypothetical protein
LSASAIVPYAGAASIFLVTLRQAYVHNLSIENPAGVWIAVYGLPGFYLLTLAVALLRKIGAIRKTFGKIVRLGYMWKLGAGTLLVLGGMILLAKQSTNDVIRLVLQMNRDVREERWTDVLESVRQCSEKSLLIACQTNYALFQKNILLDQMFAYPQYQGALGLLMTHKWCLSWSDEESDICWKLGLVNESLHWAHETYEHKGPTPTVLRRLGMAYMLKGEHGAANRYFVNLRNVPFHEKEADILIRLNENPAELDKDSACRGILSSMPIEDLISRNEPASAELDLLLRRNPKNKMAFEYLAAYQLLSGNLRNFSSLIPYFDTLNYTRMPRHAQESLLLVATGFHLR